ncbi:MAG: NAD(P)H-dependent oxidoreductase subunit E [Deltaproteobacteria bacterium]|nr:MAG: NAD(P)H-dependent oxidoreductase subunit E [Deltaproteobacteria bacterium]
MPSLVEGLVACHGRHLIAILEDIQERYTYLPEHSLKEVAHRLRMHMRDVYGVATFYQSFRLTPRGERLISVCVGTACHVRGAQGIVTELANQLGIQPGETTYDKAFSLETVNCLGACAVGPVVVIDGKYFSKVKAASVKKILDDVSSGAGQTAIQEDQRVIPVQVNCPRCNHSLMDPSHPIDDHPSIRVTISFGRKHGWHRLSSLYGSYNFESEHHRPLGVVAHYFCPHCHTELIGASECPECSATMVPMIVHGGGIAQVCPRRGCKGHMLDV